MARAPSEQRSVPSRIGSIRRFERAYPIPNARERRNTEGTVVVALTVPADGSRCDALVAKTSGKRDPRSRRGRTHQISFPREGRARKPLLRAGQNLLYADVIPITLTLFSFILCLFLLTSCILYYV